MRFREAKHSELGLLALIGARAFYRDDIYAHFYPQRSLYPEAFYDGILASLVNVFVQPGAKVFVAELENGDIMPQPGSLVNQKLIGYLTMVHHGTPEQKAQFDADSPEKALYRNLLELGKKKSPNKAIDQAAIDSFVAKQRLIVGPIIENQNVVEAVSFAILPEFQSMGYGLRFMRLIGATAASFCAGIVADASKAGFPIYMKFGFEHLGDVEVPAKTIQADDSSIINLPSLKVPIIHLRLMTKASL
ncbi:hypothetical protein LZ31DRAFT_608016 [Colletotrichum somersetense]|nr:hypothetical protein LZ31DRAFT_608016 [Colletotrichum somersetense]